MSEHISTTITTPATTEPVTAAQVIVHGRMESSAELTDWLTSIAIGAAREEAEHVIAQKIRRERLTTVWDAFDAGPLLIPFEVAQAIISLTYTDAQGLPQSIVLSTIKMQDTADGTLVYLRDRADWPTGTLPTLVFDRGFEPVPKGIQQAICLHCAYKLDNPTAGDEYKAAFAALLGPYKRWGV